MKTTNTLVLWLAATATAQLPTPSQPLAAGSPPPASAPFQPIHDAQLQPTLERWAATATCKCGIAGDGFTIVPYLGAHAPTNLPWRWQLTAAHHGGIDLLGAEPATFTAGGERAERRHRLVTERWDLRATGIEQSFLIHGPGPGAEDLLLRGAVNSALYAAERSPQVAPLVFTAPDRSCELHYGTAIAIDAEGASVAVPVAFAAGTIELRVPGSFLATAVYPVLIDPLVQVFVFDNVVVTGSGITETAVDRVDATDRLSLVGAHVRWASSLDGDVLLQKHRDDFAYTSTLYADLSPNISSYSCGVAAVDGNDRFVAAWNRGSPGATSITYVVEPADATAVNLLRIANVPIGGSERAPRLGGHKGSGPGQTNALLVRLRDTGAGLPTEVWGSVIDTVTGVEGTPFRIAGGGQFLTRDCEEPWVTRDIAVAGNAWLCAWQQYTEGIDRWTVAVARVGTDGSVSSTMFTPDVPNVVTHAMQPRVEGARGRYLIAFATASATTWPGKLAIPYGTAVWAQRFDWAGATPAIAGPARVIGSSSSRDLVVGGIAHDGITNSHWVVGHGRTGQAPTVQRFGYQGILLDQGPLPGSSNGTSTWRLPSLAFDRQLERFPLLYGTRQVDQGIVRTLLWGGHFAHPTMAEPRVQGASCSGGHPAAIGRFRIGTAPAFLALFDGPPHQPTIAALSLGLADLPLAAYGIAGGCSLLVDPLAPQWLTGVFTTTDSSGYAPLMLSLPEPLQPVDLYVQWLTADGPAIRGSSRLHVEIR
ncbi:MAG: hypothetical protein IPK26_30475 [Planctomycetes bacterium]|nr:hypothetical protein [Planctomycetota bacterium]